MAAVKKSVFLLLDKAGKIGIKETFRKCFFVNSVRHKKSCQRGLYYVDNKRVTKAHGRNGTSK